MPRSHIARRRPTWDLRCWRICPPTTSATSRPDNSSSARRMHFDTMEGLERHRGHFYNWYDTQSLKPLLPAYISTVDSGNLAGHLLTLRPGLLALPDHKILGPRLFDGLGDTLRILVDAAAGSAPAQLAQLQKDLASASDFPPDHAHGGAALPRPAGQLRGEGGRQPSMPSPRARRSGGPPPSPGNARSALDELTFLAPWTSLPCSPNRLCEFRGIDEIPTLRELARLEVELLPAIEHRLGPDAIARGQRVARRASAAHHAGKPARPGEDCGHRTARAALGRTRRHGV